MLIKLKYAKKDEIPKGYEDLYTEKGGEWVLTGVSGMKTQEDVDTLTHSLQAERNAHKETKAKLSGFNGLNAEETLAKLDRIAELEEAAKGKLDENQINQMVETRIQSRLAPVERELDTTKKQLGEANERIGVFEANEMKGRINNNAREIAQKLKVVDTAVDDVLMYANSQMQVNEIGQIVTNENAACGAGMNAEVWLTEMRDLKPHWFPQSKGAGANGSGQGAGASNPFSKKEWNLTEQGKMVATNRELAEQMAKAAGTTIGGPCPEK